MKDLKRLEVYLWWKCNYKCIFCVEKEKIDKYFHKKISEEEVFKILLKYKKQWYNHVTFLWGEPFIQSNFLFSLKIAKKLWYIVLVTTNWVLLPFEDKAKLYLPHIDELIISIPIIDNKLQPIINWVTNIIDFEKVFYNIWKYWNLSFFKINTVLNKYNYNKLNSISIFLLKYKDLVDEISITYPELNRTAFSEKYLIEKVAWKYLDVSPFVEKELEFLKSNWVKWKIVDFPFCVFSSEKYINFTDDINFEERKKVNNIWIEKNTWEHLYWKPRLRKNISECENCKYNWICWWPSIDYLKLFWESEIKAIKL